MADSTATWDAISKPVAAEKTSAPSGFDAISKPVGEPDAPTWLGRRMQDIRGKQDPQYKDVGAFQGDSLTSRAGMAAGAATTFDDKAYGDIVKKSLGERYLGSETDANGYELIKYKGEDGKAYMAYLNKPGLDRQDIGRGILSAVPFLAAGGATAAATKGLGTLGRMGAQGATAAATSVGMDATANAAGSTQDVDLGRAAIMGGFGAAGEAVAPLVAKGVAKWRMSGMVDDAGNLTPKGLEAARAAGVDPDTIVGDAGRQFARAFAEAPDAVTAGNTFSDRYWGIPATRGQLNKDPQALLNEKNIRYGAYGETPKGVMQEFDKAQAAAIERAAFGAGDDLTSAASSQPIGRMIAPERAGQTEKTALGTNINQSLAGARETARGREGELWDATRHLLPQKEALETLPASVSARLRDFRIDESLHPTANKMGDILKDWMGGKVVAPNASTFFEQTPARSIDEMRRTLLGLSKSAKDPADQAAAKAVYGGFNDWLRKVADDGLIDAGPSEVMALRKAIGFSREVREIFSARDVSGLKTPAGKRIEAAMTNGDTPEAVLTSILGSSGPQTKAPPPGSVEALHRLKTAFTRFGDEASGPSAWNDVRLAYWSNLMTNSKGEMHTPTMLVNNLKNAFANQNSVLKTLYEPRELAMMRSLQAQLERVAWKDPNPSGTASGVASGLGQIAGKAFSLLNANNGPIAAIVNTILYGPVKRAVGMTGAVRATNPQAPMNRVNVGPYTAAGGAASER